MKHSCSFRTITDEIDKNILFLYPDTERDFGIIVDGSTVGTAAMLYQLRGDDKMILGFTGKLLKPCEARYTISEIEMLLIVLY